MRRTGWVTGVVLVALGLSAGNTSGQATTSVLDRSANLDVEDVRRVEALRALQRASGVAIAFSPDVLPEGGLVTCRCREVTVAQALERILAGTGLVYVPGRRQVLVGRHRGNEPVVSERSWTLAGVVVDAQGGRPVAGADVVLSPGGRRALTGADGRFVVPRIADGRYRLQVQALQYESHDVTVDVGPGVTALRVALVRSPIPLEEIVIAPGHVGILEAVPVTTGASVSREDIEAIPQFGDDAFRTLQRMPGVAVEDISTKLNVRGGTDRDLLVRLDGVELFEPYHLKDMDGALGIVDVQALGGMDLVTGGFPAEYGDHMGGLLDMRTRQPPPSGTRSTVGMSLSSLSFSSQGSFAGGDGQWLASARRGFLDIVLSITGSDDEVSPRYWDALGRLRYLPSPNHLVSIQLLHAGDDGFWADPDDTGARVESDWSNGYAWALWTASFTPRLRAETVASVGRLTRDRRGSITNSEDGVFTPLTGQLRDQRVFDFSGLRQDWQLDLDADLLLKAGFDVGHTSGEYDYASAATFLDLGPGGEVVEREDTRRVELDASGTDVAVYGALRGRVSDIITWEAGTRLHRHSHSGDRGVSPRLMLRWDPDPETVLRASWGHYYQSHAVHQLHVGDGETTFSQAQRADQLAVGVERRIAEGLTARVEVYDRRVRDPHPLYLNLAREINPLTELESDRRRIAPTRSRARGLEVLLHAQGQGPFSWSAGYALAKAEDEVDGVWAPRTLDQRHTVTLMGTYRRGRAWQISALWHYHTGWPVTAQHFEARILEASGEAVERAALILREFGPLHASKLPDYHRFDLRLTRGFDFTRSRLEIFLDIFNVFDRTNHRGYEYLLRLDEEAGTLSAVREPGEEMLPVLPTLGFRWVF